MAEIKYEVVERIAVLSQRPRAWSPDGTRMGKGISLSHDEMAILKGLLDELEL